MPSRADMAVPQSAPRTFDEAFAELNLTPEERAALVWHLAQMRTRELVEKLLPGPYIEPWMLGVLRDGDGETSPESKL